MMKLVLLNIASVRSDGTDIPQEQRDRVKRYALAELTALYGGASSFDGEGAWAGPIGLVREGNSYVWSFVTGPARKKSLRKLAETVRDALAQDSTMLAVLELSEGSTLDFV